MRLDRVGCKHALPQHALVLADTALPACDGAVLANEDLLGYLVQKSTCVRYYSQQDMFIELDLLEIVRNNDHSSWECVDGFGKGVNGARI